MKNLKPAVETQHTPTHKPTLFDTYDSFRSVEWVSARLVSAFGISITKADRIVRAGKIIWIL